MSSPQKGNHKEHREHRADEANCRAGLFRFHLCDLVVVLVCFLRDRRCAFVESRKKSDHREHKADEAICPTSSSDFIYVIYVFFVVALVSFLRKYCHAFVVVRNAFSVSARIRVLFMDFFAVIRFPSSVVQCR